MNLEDKKKIMLNKSAKGSGYTYHDWLQSNGGAYLDLGFYFDSTKTYKIETTFLKDVHSINNMYFCGWRYANLIQGFQSGYKFGSDDAYFQVISLNTYYDVSHDIDYSRGTNIATIMINGSPVTRTSNNSSLTSQTKPFPLFCVWYGNTRYNGSTRLKETKIYIDDVLTMDLKPAEKEGELGMHDIINDVFYTNANTSGSFTIGDDV